MSASNKIRDAKTKATASKALVSSTQEAATRAEVALVSAIAALTAVGGDGNDGKKARKKAESLDEIVESVVALKLELKNLDDAAGGGTFLSGKFGFKPNATSNQNITIEKNELEAALTALKAISSSTGSSKNNTLNGSTLKTAPTRDTVITTLLGSVTKFTQNVKSKHLTSLTEAEAAKAAAEAKKAEANVEAKAAAARQQENNDNLKILSNQAMLNFNRSLKNLVDTVSKAMEENPVEASGGGAAAAQSYASVVEQGN